MGKIYKIDQVIKWTFGSDYPDFLANKTFKSKIAMVDKKNKCYGVYAEYGQDLIPFENATLIYKVTKKSKYRTIVFY